jgi:hypothetical protein
MSCEECERLRDVQDRAHRSYLEHSSIDSRKDQTTDTPNGSEDKLKEAYDAAAAEYKAHLAAAHPLQSSF